VQPHTIGHFEETFQADAVVFQGGRKKSELSAPWCIFHSFFVAPAPSIL